MIDQKYSIYRFMDGLSLLLVVHLLMISLSAFAVGDKFNISNIDDSPILRDVQYPKWFKNSFLDLNEDLEDAIDADKKGVIVYFGQKHCAYCEALMQINFGTEKDIIQYTQKHFDVIPIDIWGNREVTDFQGKVISEKKYAEREKANFTPSLIFYGKDGKELLQLRGYYTPYKLRAALEYVVDGYYKKETLRDYMSRADPPVAKFDGELNDQDFFKKPPYILQRTVLPAQKPLVVFFEQQSCHACDILHSEPLSDPITQLLLDDFEVVQLDMWSKSPLITPSGKSMLASDWAKQLGLFYSPSLVFFDEQGTHVITVSSVIRVYRLRGVLEYVLSKGYEQAPTFQRWREMQSLIE